MIRKGSKRPLEAGASKTRITDSKAKNPFVKETWEEEFEDKMYSIICEHGSLLLGFDDRDIEDFIDKYLKIDGIKGKKVKIKARKGKIVIERIK